MPNNLCKSAQVLVLLGSNLLTCCSEVGIEKRHEKGDGR
jgi:hypothetical protein